MEGVKRPLLLGGKAAETFVLDRANSDCPPAAYHIVVIPGMWGLCKTVETDDHRKSGNGGFLHSLYSISERSFQT